MKTGIYKNEKLMNWRIYQKHKKTILWAFAINIIIVIMMILPAMGQARNCGGNNAAFALCSTNYMYFVMIYAETGQDKFNIKDIDLSTFSKESHWTKGAQYFIKNDIDMNADSREIVMFCNKPYNSIPQARWGKSPFTYAAIQANGKKVLLTRTQFNKLNLNDFTNLNQIDNEK